VKDYSYDKSEFNHGNRLRDPHAAYEEKKNRSKKAYAEKCLKIDPYWRNEKILRWYHHKYKNLIEILPQELEAKDFDFNLIKSKEIINGETVFRMNQFGFSFLRNKTIKTWKF
jgi:hypothetical protein